MLPVVILSIWYLPAGLLAFLIALVGLGAALEWSQLCGFPSAIYENPLTTYRFRFVLSVAAGFILMWLLKAGALFYLALVCMFWVWMLVELIRDERLLPPKLAVIIIGWIAIVGCGLGVFRLLGEGEAGRKLLLGLLFIVWAADIGAYYTGRKFGRRSLAPAISPGKTIEGVYGAIVAGLLVAIIFAMILWQKLSLYWIVLALLVIIFSIVGDLVESREKRTAGTKDSGRLLPGHGGLLDRIDSTLAATPVFVFGALLPIG